jgi:predicted transcriptional regulator
MNDEFIDASKMNPRQQRNELILKMVDSGLSYAEIGRQVGLTRARVSQIAIDNGYIVRPTLVNLDKRNKTKND